jgi:hypothetical protein
LAVGKLAVDGELGLLSWQLVKLAVDGELGLLSWQKMMATKSLTVAKKSDEVCNYALAFKLLASFFIHEKLFAHRMNETAGFSKSAANIG